MIRYDTGLSLGRADAIMADVMLCSFPASVRERLWV